MWSEITACSGILETRQRLAPLREKTSPRSPRGGEFDYELCAAGEISFRADVAAVFENYSLHDRESETGAAIASREVGLE